jgi:hypothetical protein
VAEKSQRLFAGNLEHGATADGMRSDNGERGGTEIYSTGFEED